jgi:hypothetical protein
MKLALSYRNVLRPALFMSLLLTWLSINSVLAVELVGTPTDIKAETSSSVTMSMSEQEMALADEMPNDHDEVNHSDLVTNDDELDRKLELIKEKNRHDEAMMNPPAGVDLSPDVIVPVVAITTIFGGSLLLIIVLVRLHYRDKERRLQNINNTIDKLLAAGRDIPAELLRGVEPTSNDENFLGLHGLTARDEHNLYQGIRQIGLGLGLLVFLTIFMGIKIGAVGFILIGLGISRLVIWKLSGTEPVRTKAQE